MNQMYVCKYDEPHGSYRCLEGSSFSKATFLGRKSLKKSYAEICFRILTCSPQTSPAIILADLLEFQKVPLFFILQDSRCGSSTGTVVRCLSRDLHDSDTHSFFLPSNRFPAAAWHHHFLRGWSWHPILPRCLLRCRLLWDLHSFNVEADSISYNAALAASEWQQVQLDLHGFKRYRWQGKVSN